MDIGIASLTYWETYWSENPVPLDNSGEPIAHWVGLDVAGALFTGAVSSLSQYSVNGDVNLTVTGLAMVGGAISSSTGLVGKASKGFMKWWSSL